MRMSEGERIDRAIEAAEAAGLPIPEVIEWGGRLRMKCPGQGSAPERGCHRILLPGFNGYIRHYMAAHLGQPLSGGGQYTRSGQKKRSVLESGDRSLPVETTRAWAQRAAESRRRISDRFKRGA